VKRLEQVCLPRPVVARQEHDSGLEGQIELLVGAEVAECDARDDQAACPYCEQCVANAMRTLEA